MLRAALLMLLGALAIAVLRPIEASPTLEPTAASGSFSHTNSRAGGPVFAAARLAPGRATSGEVTITNTGSLGGLFGLAQAGVAGPLVAALRLEVLDVTGSPRRLYEGRFDALPLTFLGWFDPGQARRYRFIASFPDRGPADEPYAGASASARYVWTAIADDSPARPVPGPAADRTPPRLRLRARRVQRVISRRRLSVSASCSERCRLSARVALRIGRARPLRLGGRLRASARGGAAARLEAVIPKRQVRRLETALRDRRRVRVIFDVRARDRAGNERRARLRVTLRRR